MSRPNASRRDFLKTTALAGAGYWIAGTSRAADSTSPSEKVRFACIGVGGKGDSDTKDAGSHGDVVAICDIDEFALTKAGAAFPTARRFNDFRKMFDEMGPSIDAVTVSTADHAHAVISAQAMRMGKHCFTQKPLTHTISEARTLSKIAKETGVVTQMGNQGTANSGLRKSAAMIRAGMLGPVHEIHVWTNRPIWPQGGPAPKPVKPPKHVHWDLWLGPAAQREYAPGFHPFAWRGFWEFGTGALGDMGCHTMNMPFMALDLRNPVAIEAQTSGHNKITYPKWSIIKYEFAATDSRPAVTLTWYDGGKRPPQSLLSGQKVAESGSLVIGEKGKLYSPADYVQEYVVLGGASEPKVEFRESPGHFTEWVQEIKGGSPAVSNFADYGGPLTEMVLLGNLAVWAGRKIHWDAESMKSPDAADLEPLIKTEYRAGYSI